MESYSPLFLEEWLLSNTLSSADFYDTDQLHISSEDVLWKGQEFPYTNTTLNDHLVDSGIEADLDDTFNISWLDDESINIADGCYLPFVRAEQSKIELLTVPPEPESLDRPATTLGDGVINVLHLPDNAAHCSEAALTILEALNDPACILSDDVLTAAEVASLLSTPPSSPGDACVVPASPGLGSDSGCSSTPECDDAEYSFGSSRRKRKAGVAPPKSPRAKAPKLQNKRERKKVQNKNAATKYRVKKRLEDEAAMLEYAGIEKQNIDLKKQVETISSEIAYVKALLNEVLSCKGIQIT